MIPTLRLRKACIAGLFLTSLGCYRDLDYNAIKCEASDKGACPDGYLCSTAGLCVKSTVSADGSIEEGGPSSSPDIASSESDTSVDAVVLDAKAAIDTRAGADIWSPSDSTVFADTESPADAITDRADGVSIAVDVPKDVSPDMFDAATSDSGLLPSDASEVSTDASVIETQTRPIDWYRIPTSDSVPFVIILGPDNNVWFTEYKTSNLGRVTASGQVKEFPTPSGGRGLVVGPDQNLWYTTPDGQLGRFNPTTGDAVESSLSGGYHAAWIAAGPDGNLWFTDPQSQQIGKVTISGTSTMYSVKSSPGHIINGKDGFLWYGGDDGFLGRIDTNGSSKEFSFPTISGQGLVEAITVGGDGRLWFTFNDSYHPGTVAAMTTTGDYSLYAMNLTSNLLPYSHSIAAGPDGNVWFADPDGVARITPSGKVTVFQLPSDSESADFITAGADSCLWFSGQKNNAIGRMCP
jgi:streptogramin lyase